VLLQFFNSQLTYFDLELWAIFHNELDLDGNGHLDSLELATALQKAGKLIQVLSANSLYTYRNGPGITLAPSTLTDFMTFLTSSPHSHAVNFAEFRDFLLLLPRKISTAEIYRYYEVKKFLGDDGRGSARVTMEGQSFPRLSSPCD
jgi:solute carrier family 25 phosphate transporter 23/24/25/41